MRLKNNLGSIEISFGWLFAVIVGIAILFAAIYLSSKFINLGQESTSAEVGKEIQILLNPLETSFESSQTTSITIPTETRIKNKCEANGNFGRQGIQLDQKSFNKWLKTDVDVWTNNRYIFSKNVTEGKKFYLFSKPFNFPFKVADLVYLIPASDKYCFKNAPVEIIEELSLLKQDNLFSSNCPAGSINVCFGVGNCSIKVNYANGYVEKGTDIMYFAGVGENPTALMYAAIFSDKEVYECQAKRLVMRMSGISNLYLKKEAYLGEKGCETSLQADLMELSNLRISISNELYLLQSSVNVINEKNKERVCRLW